MIRSLKKVEFECLVIEIRVLQINEDPFLVQFESTV
jgi:hypothetical protein